MTVPRFDPPVLQLGDVTITEPTAIASVLGKLFERAENEYFVACALNRKHRVIEAAVLTIGSDRFTVVDPRQVLRWALTRRTPAASLIVAHNHPSGDSNPSSEDDMVTKSLATACHAVQLPLIDHVIVAGPGVFYSYANAGKMP